MHATRMVATSIGSKYQQQNLKQLATSRHFHGYQRLFDIHGHYIRELRATLRYHKSRYINPLAGNCALYSRAAVYLSISAS